MRATSGPKLHVCIVTAQLIVSAAWAQTPPGDAGLCYRAALAAGQPKFTAVQATLEDRFATTLYDVKGVATLCNPPLTATRPDVHAVGYRIALPKARPQPKFARTDRQVRDQFGTHALTVVRPVRLQVPSAAMLGAGGTAPPDTTGVDHYACYKVVRAKGSARFVTPAPIEFTDAFGTRSYVPTRVTQLCTPVSANGHAPTAPQHVQQLLCYRAKIPSGATRAVQSVSVNSAAFGPMVLRVTSARDLCVPAFVEASTPVEEGQTWGDCRRLVTDPSRMAVSEPDDGDRPEVTNQCVDRTCAGGVPTSSFVGLGGLCLEDGGSRCDGEGTCTNERPDVSGFLTIASCQSHWVGDGWCDAVCNDAVHNYDGGDCCPGTCVPPRRYSCGINGYNCLATPAGECLFLHGLGVSGTDVFQSTSPSISLAALTRPYWGDMAALLDGSCDPVTYANFDTVQSGWDAIALQNAYYARAFQVHNAGGVVFAHGMANNVLAGACLMQGKCGVRWIDLGGPLRGARAASVAGALAPLLGAVASSTAVASLAPDHLPAGATSPPQADGRLLQTVQARGLVTAAACGTDAWGAGGVVGTALATARERAYSSFECAVGDPLPPHTCYRWDPVPHDGVVHEDECADVAPGGALSADASNPWAQLRANHFELTGSDGNRSGVLEWLLARAAAAMSAPTTTSTSTTETTTSSTTSTTTGSCGNCVWEPGLGEGCDPCSPEAGPGCQADCTCNPFDVCNFL